jgi:hypothetical protein
MLAFCSNRNKTSTEKHNTTPIDWFGTSSFQRGVAFDDCGSETQTTNNFSHFLPDNLFCAFYVFCELPNTAAVYTCFFILFLFLLLHESHFANIFIFMVQT